MFGKQASIYLASSQPPKPDPELFAAEVLFVANGARAITKEDLVQSADGSREEKEKEEVKKDCIQGGVAGIHHIQLLNDGKHEWKNNRITRIECNNDRSSRRRVK